MTGDSAFWPENKHESWYMRFCCKVWGPVWETVWTEASFVSVIELEFCNNNLQILNSFYTFLFFCYQHFLTFKMTLFGRLKQFGGQAIHNLQLCYTAQQITKYKPSGQSFYAKSYLNSTSHFLIFNIHIHTLKKTSVFIVLQIQVKNATGIHNVLFNMLCILFP